MRSKLGIAIAVVVFVVVSVFGTYGCRNYEIDRCRDNGGSPVVPAWWSDDPANVQCLYE